MCDLGQGERPRYHRSSVVGCCDGAEPLLPSSVPEIERSRIIGIRICIYDDIKDPAGVFYSPNLELDPFSFQLYCSDFEVYP